MLISQEFNRLYHALLHDLLNSQLPIRVMAYDADAGHFIPLQDENSLPFYIIPERDFDTLDELKQLLKHLDLNYPRTSKGDPISTKEIDNTALLSHINFIAILARNSGIHLEIIEKEIEEEAIRLGLI